MSAFWRFENRAIWAHGASLVGIAFELQAQCEGSAEKRAALRAFTPRQHNMMWLVL